MATLNTAVTVTLAPARVTVLPAGRWGHPVSWAVAALKEGTFPRTLGQLHEAIARKRANVSDAEAGYTVRVAAKRAVRRAFPEAIVDHTARITACAGRVYVDGYSLPFSAVVERAASAGWI